MGFSLLPSPQPPADRRASLAMQDRRHPRRVSSLSLCIMFTYSTDCHRCGSTYGRFHIGTRALTSMARGSPGRLTNVSATASMRQLCLWGVQKPQHPLGVGILSKHTAQFINKKVPAYRDRTSNYGTRPWGHVHNTTIAPDCPNTENPVNFIEIPRFMCVTS